MEIESSTDSKDDISGFCHGEQNIFKPIFIVFLLSLKQAVKMVQGNLENIQGNHSFVTFFIS